MYCEIFGVGSSPWIPQSLSFAVALVFTVLFIDCTVYLCCFVYVHLFLFCLYKCKDYCHRVKTQLQLVIVIVIIAIVIIIIKTTLICILCWVSNLQYMTDIRMTIMCIIRALNIGFSKFLSQGGCGETRDLSRPPLQSTSSIKFVKFLFLCYVVASTLKRVKSERNHTIYGFKK